MRKSILGLSALALVAAASPAFAEDAPASDITVTGGATVVTDYRFRGISQTNENFAVQGTLGVSHSSGLYVGVWGSTIDEYVAGASDQEIDLYAGYKHSFGGATVDVGVLYYYYPGSSDLFPGVNSDYFEPYASISGVIGPVTATFGANYAPDQKALPDDNLYLHTELTGAIPNTPFTLKAHVGYTDSAFPGANYWDWSAGVDYTWNHLTFGVSYVDTDWGKDVVTSATTGRDIADAAVVGSISVAF
jgi:uncharacterized protein (TIGR02001 family)